VLFFITCIVLLPALAFSMGSPVLPMNATAAFLGEVSDWERVTIYMDDAHPLWGGRRLQLKGTGAVHLEVQKGVTKTDFMRAGEYNFKLSTAEVRGLLEAFIENDFVTIKTPERAGVMDEVRPNISLTNAKGENVTVAKWINDPVPRFDNLYSKLLALQDRQ